MPKKKQDFVCCIFCHVSDAKAALFNVQHLKKLGVRNIVVFDDAHNHMSKANQKAIITAGAKYRTTDFKRGGNLASSYAFGGMYSNIRKVLGRKNWAIKIDPDTLITHEFLNRINECEASGKVAYGIAPQNGPLASETSGSTSVSDIIGAAYAVRKEVVRFASAPETQNELYHIHGEDWKMSRLLHRYFNGKIDYNKCFHLDGEVVVELGTKKDWSNFGKQTKLITITYATTNNGIQDEQNDPLLLYRFEKFANSRNHYWKLNRYLKRASQIYFDSLQGE